jgi:tetratricopeptide (TPR) repeat protein
LERTARWEEALEAYEGLLATDAKEAAPGVLRTLRMLGDEERLARMEARFDDPKYDSPELRLERADAAFAEGRDEEARELLTELAENAPTARGYWLLSELAIERGETQAAIAACEAALKLHAETPRPIDDLRFVGLCDSRLASLRGEPERFRRLVQEFYPLILDQEESAWWAAFDAAELYFAKFDEGNGQRQFDLARAIAPRQPELFLSQARREIDGFRPAAARRTLAKLAATDPFPAETARVRADVELAQFRFDEAIASLQQALAVDPHDPHTLGRLQAIHATRGEFALDAPIDSSSAVEATANERAPQGSLFHETLGDAFDRLRKYPQAGEAYAEALRRNPASGDLYAKLGLIQMRLGEEREARRTLERAFEIDPYHVQAKNQLEVLDQLDTYAALETEHFILRFDRGQDEALAKNVAFVLEREVYPQAVERMGSEPPRTTLIEIYSDGRGSTGHQWFSARMTGMPYVGTVAACAGRVVALVSPRSLAEPYPWARVLKHEFVHVLNLDQTEFNVPHWLTEGLAVWTEDVPRPKSWLAVLAQRREAGTLFDLDSINLGFIRPENQDDWTLAYCQAEIYVRTLHSLRGVEGLRDLLDRIREGNSFEEALNQVYALTPAELEAANLEAIEALLAEHDSAKKEPSPTLAELTRRFQKDAEDVETLAGLSEAYALLGDFDRAVPFAKAALRKAPKHPIATATLARAAVAAGKLEEAEELLREAQEALPELDERLTALRIAVGLRAGDLDQVETLYRQAIERWPDEERWLKGAAKVFERQQAWDELVVVLTPLARQEHDDALLAQSLFQASLKAERPEEAERAAEALLRIRIDAAAAHAYVGERAFLRGEFDRARLALESALLFDPQRPGVLPRLIELAEREGDQAQADELRRRLDDAPAPPDQQESPAPDDELP